MDKTNAMMERYLKHVLTGLLILGTVIPVQAQKKGNAGGYLITRLEKADQAYNAGYSMYSAAYPLLKDYPGREFQSGLFGTWMHPHYDDPLPVDKLYTDIEGGLGWWRDTEYATETPKFIMGGVQRDFIGWANGPGAGKGRDWNDPKGKYGVAQLSPWVLWPPDGLNLKQGTCGEFFGSGYLPLPLTEPKAITRGEDISTGNQCWTLFVNAANFKGPIAFFTPFFWSEASVEDPILEGLFLDQRPSQANKPFQMETQHIHSAEATDHQGQKYVRMATTQYPVDAEGNTNLLHRLMVYNKQALWDGVEAWFNGGKPHSGQIDVEQASMQSFHKGVRSSWRFYGEHIPKDQRALMNITRYLDASVTEPATLKVRWEGDLIKKRETENGALVILPEYYKWVREADEEVGQWIAVHPDSVPEETGLHKVDFRNKTPRNKLAYITPTDEESSWKNPGPAAGPFKVLLGDGSTLTYYWYRFADQPALLHADLTLAEREDMQRRVELLHKHWTKDREYLPPPLFGELAEIDPALLVDPPPGMEIGYVPIVTSQGLEEYPTCWSFDKKEDSVLGYHRLVEGVKGEGLVLDGYTTRITRPAYHFPRLGQEFSIEAWIAIGAYPWNWAPIAAQENTESSNSNLDQITWPDDLTEESPKEGFFFGVGPQGQLGLHIGNGIWEVCQTTSQIPLRVWTHVAATLDHNQVVTLYINGEKAAQTRLRGAFRQAILEDLRIGMPRQQIEASNPVRAFATLPSWYAFDGILDEIQIHRTAVASDSFKKTFTALLPDSDPDLPLRIMPSGPPGPGKFGASYTHLKFFPEWDAQWRVESDPDVVVQFDDSPVRVVFWRGTRYGPAWVMENGMWMGDQSIENFNGTDGCIEHMLDPRCRFSHVRIIENTPARIVVHWRYLPTAANGNHSQVNPVSGWEDWVDEYYTFYPDQLGVRKVVLHTDGIPLWPEEVIAFCQPGQRPEDVVELEAMTLANLNGKQHTYSWAEQSPKFRHKSRWEYGGYIHFGDELGEKPNIMMVNMKSAYKPYQIFELECNFTCFAHEHRKDVSHFPWWNHWPAAMIPSDGRYCQAADRPSHFSLAWGTPVPHKGTDNTYVWTWIYGATKEDISALTPLARSWTRPPELMIISGASEGFFDSTQRCYVISKKDNNQKENLSFNLQATHDSPVFNPAFLIKNWGDHPVELSVNGKKLRQGNTFRTGYVRTVNEYDLVIWLEMESNSQVEFSIKKKNP